MSDDTSGEFERLLVLSRQGDRRAFDRLVESQMVQLHRVAEALMRQERRDHTLQPTALCNQAYAKLLTTGTNTGLNFVDKLHFRRIFARNMRQILKDHAKGRNARPDRIHRAPLDVVAGEIATAQDVDYVALDAAIEALAAIDQQRADIVEMFYFGGLTIEHIGRLLGMPERTVRKRLQLAREWIKVRLGREGIGGLEPIEA